MSRVEAKLIELGSPLPELAKPVASYIAANQSGNLIFTAGQLPFVNGALPITGKLGQNVDEAQGHALARQCALNALAAVKGVIGDLDRVTKIVKLTGYVASTPDFIGQPKVVNGASDFLLEVFGESGRHSRTSVGVPSLPLDAPVEIELIVEFA